MNTHAQKTQSHNNQSAASQRVQEEHHSESSISEFVDNRPEAVAQRQFQETANNSQKSLQLKAFREMANDKSEHQQVSLDQSNAPASPAVAQRTRDKDYNELTDLGELNTALFGLTPEITGISLGMLGVPGASRALLNQVIAQDNNALYDGIKRKDVLDFYKQALITLVNTHPPTFAYDPHGAKHFPGGPPGTKFTAGSGVVNPLLVALITPEIGRIRRDAKGKNQSYYLTDQGIAQCNGKDLTIQVDFNFATDTITYHGYPDDNVQVYSLSRAKGGAAI